MAAAKYDFAIEQGTSFKISWIYKNQNGTPINLTNWCARLIWKTNLNATQAFHSENTDYSVYKFTIDDLNGKLIKEWPSAKEACLYFNPKDLNGVSAACLGKQKTAFGFIWKYKE